MENDSRKKHNKLPGLGIGNNQKKRIYAVFSTRHEKWRKRNNAHIGCRSKVLCLAQTSWFLVSGSALYPTATAEPIAHQGLGHRINRAWIFVLAIGAKLIEHVENEGSNGHPQKSGDFSLLGLTFASVPSGTSYHQCMTQEKEDARKLIRRDTWILLLFSWSIPLRFSGHLFRNIIKQENRSIQHPWRPSSPLTGYPDTII